MTPRPSLPSPPLPRAAEAGRHVAPAVQAWPSLLADRAAGPGRLLPLTEEPQ
jgi:hypothetical protein